MRAVGIKALKNKLSEYVRVAAEGETVLVTDRDRVVAELGPRGRAGLSTPATRSWQTRFGEAGSGRLPRPGRVADAVRTRLTQRPAIMPVAAVVLATSIGIAQESQTPPVFRGGANLIEVPVRVTDREGHPVRGLTAADFELRENGRPQTIVAFHAVNLPLTADEPRAAASSLVESNERAGTARFFVLLLDDMLTDVDLTLHVRRTAREFVERYLKPGDFIAVMSTSGRSILTQDFTTDRTRALAAIDRFMGSGCREDQAVLALETLARIAEHLGGVRGRRVSVVWISEGVGYPLEPSMPAPGAAGVADSMGRSGSVRHFAMELPTAMSRLLDALRRESVTLYAVDPRGLTPTSIADPGCFVRGGALRLSLGSLRNLSEQTGGFAAINTNDFDEPFARILAENSEYYILGYQPASLGRAGEFRRIRVTLPGRRDLRVASARPGFAVSVPRAPALPSGVPPAVGRLLTMNVPEAGLPLRVQPVVTRGPDGQGRMQAVVEVPAVTPGARVHLGLRVIDDTARVVVDLAETIDVGAGTEPGTAGLRWAPAIALPPGHYSLRAAGESAAGDTGSVFADIDVPRFDDEGRCPTLLPHLCGFWIGGLALTSPAAARVVTRGSPSDLPLPFPPTTARTFVLGDVITAAASVVTPRDFRTGTLQLTVHAQTAAPAGVPLLSQTAPLADRAEAHQPRAWQVDTARLGTGAFILRLTVRDHEGRSREAVVGFEVVGTPSSGAG